MRKKEPLAWWKTLLLSVPIVMLLVFSLETEIEIEQLAVTRDGLLAIGVMLALVLGVYVYARRK